MASHLDSIMAMREFAEKHLPECAQELIDWGQSSILAENAPSEIYVGADPPRRPPQRG